MEETYNHITVLSPGDPHQAKGVGTEVIYFTLPFRLRSLWLTIYILADLGILVMVRKWMPSICTCIHFGGWLFILKSVSEQHCFFLWLQTVASARPGVLLPGSLFVLLPCLLHWGYTPECKIWAAFLLSLGTDLFFFTVNIQSLLTLLCLKVRAKSMFFLQAVLSWNIIVFYWALNNSCLFSFLD